MRIACSYKSYYALALIASTQIPATIRNSSVKNCQEFGITTSSMKHHILLLYNAFAFGFLTFSECRGIP